MYLFSGDFSAFIYGYEWIFKLILANYLSILATLSLGFGFNLNVSEIEIEFCPITKQNRGNEADYLTKTRIKYL